MANVLVEENSLTAIANSIRGKNGTTNTYKPGEMAAAINAIETGGNADRMIPFYTSITDNYSVQNAVGAKICNTMFYRFTGSNNIWPCVSFTSAKPSEGTIYRLRFKLWTNNPDGYPMAGQTVYLNGNHRWDLGCERIPYNTAYTFEVDFNYRPTTSIYEPVLHIYPNKAEGSGDLYIVDFSFEKIGFSYDASGYVPESLV